ncbi:MAG: hypothetical protein HY841_06820 [Bacteroidetes bacterium]|nr:hypothetical protein [Bacteroidota bacterium]
MRFTLIILLLTAIKIIFSLLIKQDIFLYEDHDIAVNLLKTGNFFYDCDGARHYSFQFPIYPFMLFMIYKISNINLFCVILYHIFLNMLTAFMLPCVFQKWLGVFNLNESLKKYSGTIVKISVLIFLLHPIINYYIFLKIHPFIENLFFFTLLNFLMFRFLEKNNFQNLFLYAIAFGFAVMDRTTLAISILPFLILSKNRFGFLRLTRNTFILFLVTGFVNAPWLIRNFHKDNIVGFASSGRDLWKGSIPDSEGSNYLNSGLNYYSALSTKDVNYIGTLTPAGQNDFFINKFVKNVKENPSGYLKLYLLKLKNFWMFRKLIGNEYPFFIQQFIPFYKFFFLTILILAFTSCFFIRKTWILMTMPVALSLFHAFFYVETRHRLLIEPLLIFLALISAAKLYSLFKKSNYNTLRKFIVSFA